MAIAAAEAAAHQPTIGSHCFGRAAVCRIPEFSRMTLQLVAPSLVVTAQQFNPSVTGQHWLITNGIILEDEMQVGAVFTDVVVQVPTRDFHLLVTPESCQFTFAPHVNEERQQALIRERLSQLVSLLPHTPYTAVGLNFTWHFFPEGLTIGEACRQLFFAEGKPLHRCFDIENARFGSYMSMDWNGFRLRLNAMPILRTLPDGHSNEVIQLAFNYHQPVAGRPNPSDDISRAIGSWTTARVADHRRCGSKITWTLHTPYHRPRRTESSDYRPRPQGVRCSDLQSQVLRALSKRQCGLPGIPMKIAWGSPTRLVFRCQRSAFCVRLLFLHRIFGSSTSTFLMLRASPGEDLFVL